MQLREGLRILVGKAGIDVTVRLPHDPDLQARFQKRFRHAYLGRGTGLWHIPGKLALARAQRWAIEEEPYLTRLENEAREAEWGSTSAAISEKASAETKVTDPLWINRPGHSGRPLPAPEGALDRAIEAIRTLHRELDHETLFGFIDPPVSLWRAGPGHEGLELSILAQGRALKSGAGCITVSWQWKQMFHGIGWSQDGWQPDSGIYALTNSMSVRVRNALNAHIDAKLLEKGFW